jgi:hypothetical protein
VLQSASSILDRDEAPETVRHHSRRHDFSHHAAAPLRLAPPTAALTPASPPSRVQPCSCATVPPMPAA